jgi:16S rRNA processing protein RimM
MARTVDSTSSTERADARRDVPVGRVVAAHGLRGELRVRSDCVDALTGSGPLHVRLARDEGDREPQQYEIEEVRPGRQGECRVTLAGIADRGSAEALRGCALLMSRSDLPPLADGEFYQVDLVGCRVEDGAGREIGVVRGIWETGAADVLVIEDAAGREILVPAAESVLREVDLAGGRVVIDAPPGLLDLD